jgi:hypothetical protein
MPVGALFSRVNITKSLFVTRTLSENVPNARERLYSHCEWGLLKMPSRKCKYIGSNPRAIIKVKCGLRANSFSD